MTKVFRKILAPSNRKHFHLLCETLCVSIESSVNVSKNLWTIDEIRQHCHSQFAYTLNNCQRNTMMKRERERKRAKWKKRERTFTVFETISFNVVIPITNVLCCFWRHFRHRSQCNTFLITWLAHTEKIMSFHERSRFKLNSRLYANCSIFCTLLLLFYLNFISFYSFFVSLAILPAPLLLLSVIFVLCFFSSSLQLFRSARTFVIMIMMMM